MLHTTMLTTKVSISTVVDTGLLKKSVCKLYHEPHTHVGAHMSHSPRGCSHEPYPHVGAHMSHTLTWVLT